MLISRPALVCLLGGVCFGQSGPGAQRLLQVKAWKGTLKIVRNVPATASSTGSYSANTVLDLQLNLDTFDGLSWTGSAMGTLNLNETLTIELPGCMSVTNAKAARAVSAQRFGLTLNLFSDSFSFNLFDPSLVSMDVTTTLDCGGNK